MWIFIAALTGGIAWVVYKKYFQKGKSLNIFTKVNPNNNTNFLFIGDSLTAYNSSYADQLKQAYPDITIKKIAEVGKQTSWMLPQLQTELSDGTKYDVITIWGGVNDIYATNQIANAESNLQKMYDVAKESGAKVVALTIPPTATYNISTPQTTQLTNDLNNWINNNQTVDAVVDVNSLVNDGNDGTRPEYLQPDTLHLTDAAHAQIEKDFQNRVIK